MHVPVTFSKHRKLIFFHCLWIPANVDIRELRVEKWYSIASDKGAAPLRRSTENFPIFQKINTVNKGCVRPF